jgi:hypothetical protein
MQLGGRVVKLTGDLTVESRHCDCCNSSAMLRLTGDEGQEFFYCKECFTDNCKCGGRITIVEEK